MNNFIPIDLATFIPMSIPISINQFENGERFEYTSHKKYVNGSGCIKKYLTSLVSKEIQCKPQEDITTFLPAQTKLNRPTTQMAHW